MLKRGTFSFVACIPLPAMAGVGVPYTLQLAVGGDKATEVMYLYAPAMPPAAVPLRDECSLPCGDVVVGYQFHVYGTPATAVPQAVVQPAAPLALANDALAASVSEKTEHGTQKLNLSKVSWFLCL